MRLEDAGRLAEVEVLLPLAPGDVHVPAAVDELRRRDVELVAQGLEGVRDDPAVVASPVGVVDVAAQGMRFLDGVEALGPVPVSYTHLRAHETRHDLVCRLLLEK